MLNFEIQTHLLQHGLSRVCSNPFFRAYCKCYLFLLNVKSLQNGAKQNTCIVEKLVFISVVELKNVKVNKVG